nr:DapH/DapD/GlmU-related protein [Cellulosimicrobium sp. MM]
MSSTTEPTTRMAELAATDEDLRSLLSGGWLRYRTSPALQELTRTRTRRAPASGACTSRRRRGTRLFHRLVPGAEEGIDFRPPRRSTTATGCDRRATFINADFMVIGGGLVTIGPDCLIGPRCSIYTPNHAEDVVRRREGWERPEPVTIGSNVWIGGSVTITPGVTIGDDSIIGPGPWSRGTPRGRRRGGEPVPTRPHDRTDPADVTAR